MASIDRISALPDEVLVHILSFLTTKTSVSTDILSRRWRFLWALVPKLDFDSVDFSTVTSASFPNIIDEVLSLHKGYPLHTFRLDLVEYQCTNSEMERWISAAIAINVQNIDIHHADLTYDEFLLPQCLFTCKTVEELSLNRCGFIPSTGDVSLPRLKKLGLEMVKYESDESLAHVLSGSPVLEELTVWAANHMDTVVCCCISSPSLNRLVLESEFEFDEFEDEAFRVKIDTPALRYLKLSDWESQNVSAGRLTSLYEADICFHDKEYRDDLDSQNVIEFVGKLYNVKYLTLSTGSMKVSNSVFSGLTVKFHNLTELTLSADSRFVTYFLENADNLRSLTINMEDEYLEDWMESNHIPTSLVSHLEIVRFKWFKCKEVAFDIVRYILRNAKVSKMIEIYFHPLLDLEEKTKACKRISLFERGSEACHLYLH